MISLQLNHEKHIDRQRSQHAVLGIIVFKQQHHQKGINQAGIERFSS